MANKAPSASRVEALRSRKPEPTRYHRIIPGRTQTDQKHQALHQRLQLQRSLLRPGRDGRFASPVNEAVLTTIAWKEHSVCCCRYIHHVTQSYMYQLPLIGFTTNREEGDSEDSTAAPENKTPRE